MIQGKQPLKHGEHVWVIRNKKIILGVILNWHEYRNIVMYNIIIPISSDKCSMICLSHDDKNLFTLKERQNAEQQLEQYLETNTTNSTRKTSKKSTRRFYVRRSA